MQSSHEIDAGEAGPAKAVRDAPSSVLYSRNRVIDSLPFNFATTILILLCYSVLFNLLFLSFAIQGLHYEWNDARNSVGLLFMLMPIPAILSVLSCLDLYKRLKRSLLPQQLVITTSISLALSAIATAMLGTCEFGGADALVGKCPNALGQMWVDGWYYTYMDDMAPLLPFLAMADTAFYILYLSIGLISRKRDFDIQNKSPFERFIEQNRRPNVLRKKQSVAWADDVGLELRAYDKRSAHKLSSSAISIEHTAPDTTRSEDEHNRESENSFDDSSMPDISAPAASTIAHSKGASTSLVTPGSVRSTAISSASTWLPAYSERRSSQDSEGRP